MEKGLFFVSDYRDVTCKEGRDPAYWILKSLDKSNEFNVYSTANNIIDQTCFKNINFLPIHHRGSINIQNPRYNYNIYKKYKEISDEVSTIHHCEKFQYERGYNLIPLISNIEDKNLIIGPIHFPHEVFENDFFARAEKHSTIHKLLFQQKEHLNSIFRRFFKETIDKADTVIVPNKEVKNEILDYVSNDKIEMINYGVNLSAYNGYSYCADENNFNIVYAGSAIERKGIEYLLEAISILKKEFNHIKLHMLSDGYRIEMYKKMAEEMNLNDNIIFHGRLGKNEYLEVLSRSKLLCLPTLSESYSWTVLDAMCMGVPVVTTDKGRCDDLFENGNIGLKVKSQCSDELAEAIAKLFSDIELCKTFSENGLKKRDNYDYDKISQKYLKLYEKYI